MHIPTLVARLSCHHALYVQHDHQPLPPCQVPWGPGHLYRCMPAYTHTLAGYPYLFVAQHSLAWNQERESGAPTRMGSTSVLVNEDGHDPPPQNGVSRPTWSASATHLPAKRLSSAALPRTGIARPGTPARNQLPLPCHVHVGPPRRRRRRRRQQQCQRPTPSP